MLELILAAVIKCDRNEANLRKLIAIGLFVGLECVASGVTVHRKLF